MTGHNNDTTSHHHRSSGDKSVGKPRSERLPEVDGTSVGTGNCQCLAFGQAQPAVTRGVIDVIGENDLESVEAEALPHLDR